MTKISPAHMCLQSAAHAFTASGVCGVFTITLIWIVENYWQTPWCVAILVTAVYVCLVLETLDLTKFQRVQNRTRPHCDKVATFTHSVPLLCSLLWLAVKFKVEFKICFSDLQTSCKTTCLSSLHACPITPILFTEI